MLHMFHTYVARVCSECFTCFSHMLQQVFHSCFKRIHLARMAGVCGAHPQVGVRAHGGRRGKRMQTQAVSMRMHERGEGGSGRSSRAYGRVKRSRPEWSLRIHVGVCNVDMQRELKLACEKEKQCGWGVWYHGL
jgi:hypothetical protein